jgi:ferredoxin-thioredoxin reductase catalytic subunit
MTPEKLYTALSKFAEARGMELNAGKAHVMDIMRGLLKNEQRYGYRSCPCRLAKNDGEKDRDIVCPCTYMPPDVEEFGSCYCGLYVSKEWNRGGIPHVKTPERRPIDSR